jgi:hypothetical protein
MKKAILFMIIIPFFFISYSQNTKSTVLTNAREKLGEQKFIRMSKMIYAGVTTGINGKKIKAYQNDMLTNVTTPEEIRKKGSTEESIQIPIDKKDPSSPLMDTVIRNDFRPDDVKGFRLLQTVTKSEEPMKYSADMVGISLTFDMVVSGIRLGEQDLFYVKFEDLKTILDEKTFNELVDACIP